MAKESDEFKRLNQKIEAMIEEENVVEAELNRDSTSQVALYENVANEAKQRMESCQINSK